MSTTAAQNTKTLTIMGPRIIRGHAVRNAIDALVYLPESYRLVFAGHPQDQSFYNEVVAAVERCGLSDRVRFMYEVESPDMFVASDGESAKGRTVSGNSPEALASAVLRTARAAGYFRA